MDTGLTRAPIAGWSMTGRVLALERPLIMGIVNVTPDSFSDGGRFLEPSAALEHARRLIDEGADILDIGGESTRPGSAAIPESEEIARVVPVLEALRTSGVVLSVDTSKPGVMRAALDAGAAIVNDVCALQAPGALDAVAASDCGVVLMHMQGSPRTMQLNPHYTDVVGEVRDFLRERIAAATARGVAAVRIVVDPGFGFGKTVEHNFELLGRAGGADQARRADPRRRLAQGNAGRSHRPGSRRPNGGFGRGDGRRGRARGAYRASARCGGDP